jgi:hypothetical protein
VKRERLDFLADNPFYTKRFAHYVGRRCRSTTIKDLAKELNLDWDTVKTGAAEEGWCWSDFQQSMICWYNVQHAG